MKNTLFSITCFLFLATCLLFCSCGESKGHFKLEGRFLNLNQGEFYVYSLDGAIDGVDTIKVEGGRFAYEIPCDKEGTLIVVFPNFSCQPVFVESGGSVEMNADAGHLKEMEIKGTNDNDLMSKFRTMTSNMSPQEEQNAAAQFVKDNLDSYICTYLIRNYFIDGQTPDYKKALSLIKLVKDKQKQNGYIIRLERAASNLNKLNGDRPLPDFSDIDINGANFSSSSLKSSPVAVISVWATWNFDSQNMQRQLKNQYRKSGGKLKLLSICMDGSKKECSNSLKRDSISWTNICDGNMFDGKTVKALGITSVPDNILIRNGKIVAHGLRIDELNDRLEKILR
nr:DUF4369 domain-containing protein [Prevotella sp.]